MSHSTAFFLGATGYVGGSVLVSLVKKFPQIHFTALVRSPKDNQAIEALGVTVLQGSHSDLALIEKAALEHDVVFNFGDSDDLPLTEAILRGQEARARRNDGSPKPILIHTSGTGVIIDAPLGEFRDTRIYDDLNVEETKGIDEKQPHRNVDLKIFEAGERNLIDGYIVAPCTIFGTGLGPVRNTSIQVNALIRFAVQHRQVYQVGAGTNEWTQVHIIDLVDLYVRLFQHTLTTSPSSEPAYEKFYWGSAGTYTWGPVARKIATLLHKRGAVDTVQVKSVTVQEEPKLALVGSNSRSVANRAKKVLGWKPSARELVDSLEEEVDLTLAQM